MFDILSAIETKKRGESLKHGKWTCFIENFDVQSLPDYQVSALMMAVCLRGMSDDETIELTEAILRSGETLNFGGLGRPLVDKHSTGGVGDKVTPILVPLLIASGCAICKMSGRGLGHTGGTVDKLESIPGLRTSLTQFELESQMQKHYGAMIGQSGILAPADRKLYALRDVTGTVDSVPLIASSIMSKKLAGGADVICLDVKTGDGALFKSESEAFEFARLAVLIGDTFHKEVRVVYSSMESPLGLAVGNALEIREVLEVLEGGKTDRLSDLINVVLELGSEILLATKIASGKEQANGILTSNLSSGKAMSVFEAIVKEQGGSLVAFNETLSTLNNRTSIDIKSPSYGRIAKIKAKQIGDIARSLGAGRYRLEDEIDLFAGVVLKKKPCDALELGEAWATCYFDPLNSTVIEHLRTSDREVQLRLVQEKMNDSIVFTN